MEVLDERFEFGWQSAPTGDYGSQGCYLFGNEHEFSATSSCEAGTPYQDRKGPAKGRGW